MLNKGQLKEKWDSLTPDKKKRLIIILLAISIVILSIIGYFWSRAGTQEQPKKEVSKQEEIKLDPTMLQKTQLAESQKEIRELKQQLEEIKKAKDEQERELRRLEEERIAKQQQQKGSAIPPLPPPVPASGPPGAGVPPPVPPAPKVEVLGDIKVVSNEKKTPASQKEQQAESDKKKRMVYLPPSFMEATLLSGLDAPAVSKGEGNPVPVLFRVKAPAVLPNSVKANLKGCFVIAEGLGSLADERAHLRLVNISCVGRKGQAVIDQKIKGFVVDNDGKIGLRGRVVSKMGSHLARTFIAGLFSGLAQVTGTQSYTYSVSGGGVVSSLNPGDAGKAAVSSGITQTASALQKFYLELAQQTIPVVEIQATRTVTLVVSEGVSLEIKEHVLPE